MAGMTWDGEPMEWGGSAMVWDGGDEPDPEPPTAKYPDPSDVRLGVKYGPNGDDYTGTMTSGPAQVYFFGVQT